MATYKIVFKKSVASDLKAIPKRDVQRILARINSLADDPRGKGSEKLSGQERYRVRQGSYRILYLVRDREIVVVVVKVGHRRDI